MDKPVERLEKIYDEFEACLDVNLDWDKVRDLMIKYDNHQSDINILKTVMIITKGFKNHEKVKDIRESIVMKYENLKKPC
jgi:hypothetical protein